MDKLIYKASKLPYLKGLILVDTLMLWATILSTNAGKKI